MLSTWNYCIAGNLKLNVYYCEKLSWELMYKDARLHLQYFVLKSQVQTLASTETTGVRKWFLNKSEFIDRDLPRPSEAKQSDPEPLKG